MHKWQQGSMGGRTPIGQLARVLTGRLSAG